MFAWWTAHATLVLGHVLDVFPYWVAVARDLPAAAYSAYAERSGRWFSILFGGPVFYLLGRILRRRPAYRARLLRLAVWTLLKAQWTTAQGIKLLAI